MSANQGKKVNAYSEINAMADDSTFVVLQKIDGIRKVRQFTKEAFAAQFGEMFVHPIEVTRAQLLTLIANDELKVRASYQIISGTPGDVQILVRARTSNTIEIEAVGVAAEPIIYHYNLDDNLFTMTWRASINKIEGYDQLTRRLVVLGDSISNDSGGDFPYWIGYSQYFAHAPIVNYAIAGQTAAQVNTGYNTTAATKAPIIGTTQDYWLSTYCGINDLVQGATATAVYNSLTAIWQKGRADGYKIIAYTLMYSTDLSVGEEAERVALNDLILSNQSLYDMVVRPDLILSPTTTPALFVDGTHPNVAGSQLFANLINYTFDKKRPFALYGASGYTGEIPTEWLVELLAERLGIGTSTPQSVIDIEKDAPIMRMNNVADVVTNPFGLEFWRTTNLEGYVKYLSSTAQLQIASGRSVAWGGVIDFMIDTAVKMRLKGNTLNITNIPTSSAGLVTGDIWSDGGTLKIV